MHESFKKTITTKKILSGLLVLQLSLVSAQSRQNDQSENHYGKGYTIINATEITNADLSQTVNVRVAGRRMRAMNIGQGLDIILQKTGWRLERGIGVDPQVHRLLNSPWPESWNLIGPDSLGNVLKTIGGVGWQLVIDPVNRLVSYEINPRLVNQKNTRNMNQRRP